MFTLSISHGWSGAKDALCFCGSSGAGSVPSDAQPICGCPLCGHVTYKAHSQTFADEKIIQVMVQIACVCGIFVLPVTDPPLRHVCFLFHGELWYASTSIHNAMQECTVIKHWRRRLQPMIAFCAQFLWFMCFHLSDNE